MFFFIINSCLEIYLIIVIIKQADSIAHLKYFLKYYHRKTIINKKNTNFLNEATVNFRKKVYIYQ